MKKVGCVCKKNTKKSCAQRTKYKNTQKKELQFDNATDWPMEFRHLLRSKYPVVNILWELWFFIVDYHTQMVALAVKTITPRYSYFNVDLHSNDSFSNV